MQSKGAIKILAVALALVCIYQLSFTFFARVADSKARKYATSQVAKKLSQTMSKGDQIKERMLFDSISRARESFYIDSIQNQPIYNLLVKKYTYKDCKEREINLGLDLKGGMNVTLEVSVPDIIKSMAKDRNDSIVNRTIRVATQMQNTSQKDYVVLFGEAFKQVASPGMKLAAFFNKSEYATRIKYNSTDEEVLKVIEEETKGAIDRTFNILRTRIDRFGVTQPNIQKLQTAGRILIELPGIKDPSRVRKLLQGTAQLEFWETYEYSELYGFFAEANKKLASIDIDTNKTKTDSTKLAAKTDKKADTTSLVKKANIEKAKPSEKLGANKQYDEYVKTNPLFAYLRPALFQDEKKQWFPNKGPVVGYASIKDTVVIDRMLKNPKVISVLPRNLKLVWSVKPRDAEKGGTTLELIALKISSRDGTPALGGDVIIDARQDFDQTGRIEISMTMNNEGAKTWKRLTADNLGKSVAIVLDNYAYSFPTVQSEIPNGRSQITGNFTIEEAKDLANILKAGKLPAPAKIIEEAVVGPSLGKEAINAGLLSFVIAFIGVLLYMSLYYNGAGHVADVALFANVFFLFGVLASVGAVLTLPGIAGIVLTLAMAVDGNVIIYERMREELRAGKGARLVVKDGFHHAYSAIIDGHVTTILTGVVLYIFGSGPVQGFATTLIIGLVLSLFSSIFIARLIFEWMLDKNMEITVDNKYTRNAFHNVNIDFIGIRKTMYVISGIVILIGIVSLFIRGLDPGVDFTGGRTYVVRFDQSVKTNAIRNSLTKVFDNEAPEVKTFGPDNQVKITTKYLINNSSPKTDSIVNVALYNGLSSSFKKPISYNDFSTHSDTKTIGELSSQKVSPTISYELIQQAFMAVFFGLVIIFIYIAIRFKNWKFGMGGVVSLFHDTMIVVTMFSLFYGIFPFSLEVDQSFIAAILTIIGYSIMDSVIIFDRIREYRVLYPKRELDTNINMAINSTLGRTINTSGITLVVLIVIFIFGGEILRGFIFALLVGVAVGTYSSVFNATPVAYDLILMMNKRAERKKLKAASKA